MSEVSPGDLGKLLVAGLTHRTASPALRDLLFREEPPLASLLRELKAQGLDEVVLLATCDRFELVATGDKVSGDAALTALSEKLGASGEEFLESSRVIDGEAALSHLYAVASSLDSQVVGEPQVLGQVKAAARAAEAAGTYGPVLDRCLQAAYAAAKKIRNESAIGEESVSLAMTALKTAEGLHGELSKISILLLGLGDLGELLCQSFRDAGARQIEVLHSSKVRTGQAAARLGGNLRAPEELAEALERADVVIAAWGAGRYQVSKEDVKAALKARRRRPILLFDLSVPSDLDPAIDELDDAFLYRLDDLERLALSGAEKREAAAKAAWEVLDRELAATLRQAAERDAVPALKALRERAESLRREVLASGKLDSEEATRLLLARLLHEPSEALRQAAAEGEDLEAALRRLFRLDQKKD